MDSNPAGQRPQKGNPSNRVLSENVIVPLKLKGRHGKSCLFKAERTVSPYIKTTDLLSTTQLESLPKLLCSASLSVDNSLTFSARNMPSSEHILIWLHYCIFLWHELSRNEV